jgi:NAD(P)-dependent dehydrogenase (short-subunit alcohol dehydrogenase family)
MRLEALDGAVAVVTGGASGIGAAVVRRLAEAGAKPAVWDIAPRAQIACEVSDSESVRAAYDRTVRDAGIPQVLVTCAGTGSLRPVIEMTLEEWDRVQSVNLHGTLLCLQVVARGLIERSQPGAIVCISSISARIVDPGMSAYSASKAGIEALARTAAAELGKYGIRINCVAPGVTDTPLAAGNMKLPGFVERARERTPLGRPGQPDDIAGAVMALLQASGVTGQVLDSDGGLCLYSPMDAAGMRGER